MQADVDARQASLPLQPRSPKVPGAKKHATLEKPLLRRSGMDPTRSALRAANFILAALFSVGGPGRAMEAPEHRLRWRGL